MTRKRALQLTRRYVYWVAGGYLLLVVIVSASASSDGASEGVQLNLPWFANALAHIWMIGCVVLLPMLGPFAFTGMVRFQRWTSIIRI